MAARPDQTTAYLSEWAAGFRLEDAPAAVVERMKALVLDLLRVVAVGATLPWSRDARRYALRLGGKPASTVLFYGDRMDPVRAAFVNGSFAHACDLDDTHVGSMHHSGASVLPAALAIAEKENASGRALLEAAICGYEASLRIGLAVQPSLFHRGFLATATCGPLGAALAAGKLMRFSADDMAGALGAACTYAGGLAQFYKSGSVIKRVNAGKAAECGVISALLVRDGIWGPRDILEGKEAGFFRAFSDQPDPSRVTGDLGRGYRLMEVSTKVHAGAGRLQASNEAGLSLGAGYRLTPGQIADVEVGIPRVIQGMLTKNDPHDVQSGMLSVPFSLAMALSLGRTRGAQAGIRPGDYDTALADPAVRALALRVRCVVDPGIEAKTNTEEVPSRVTVTLADGRRLEARVDHPRGSPHRPMAWDEISRLFRDTVAGALPEKSIARVIGIVAGLDRKSTARDITAAFVAAKASPRTAKSRTRASTPGKPVRKNKATIS
ncbi:MAG TPA: MmgE/PrpD family protein [Burkholderiales bacterium]|nr:MmgE/PrpD family protein [Burkholderiales bacterium]